MENKIDQNQLIFHYPEIITITILSDFPLHTKFKVY